MGTGPYRGFDESDTPIAFAMPVELGGKRHARVAVADAKVRRAWIDLAVAEADRRVAVTEAYVAPRRNRRARRLSRRRRTP